MLWDLTLPTSGVEMVGVYEATVVIGATLNADNVRVCSQTIVSGMSRTARDNEV